MNSKRTTRIDWRGLIPRGRLAIIALIVVAGVAFTLGGLLLGGGKSREPAHGISLEQSASESSKHTLWTCSMHPQIQLPKPGKCPICFMDLIPVETGSDGDELDPNQIRMSETAVKLANIQTTPVIRAYAERSIRMVGKLDYDETRVAYMTAWVPGRLDRLFVDYTGARVSKGDHMVHMYSPELIATQEELLQAIKAVRALDNGGSIVLKNTARETVTSAREKLRLYGLSDEQIAEIESAGEPRSHLTIQAPIGGVVVHKDAREGMYVQTGTRIYTIADLSKLWVLLEAYESDLPWLKYGQHIAFTSPSFPGETFDAVISFIDPVVDPKTRTVDVRAVVSNEDGRLKPQMFVSGVVFSQLGGNGNVMSLKLAGKWICPTHPEIVKDGPGKCDVSGRDLVPAEQLGFTAGESTSAGAPLLIPATSPLVTGKRAVVYVQIPSERGPIFEGRQVVLGPRAGEYYVVAEGLEEGELVVTNGAFKIDSELQIQAKPSMMSPEGGVAVAVHDHGQETSPKAQEKVPVSEAEDEGEHAERLEVSEEARAALTPLYDAYFKTQMALANDELETAKKGFAELASGVESTDMGLFAGEAHAPWMKMSGALTAASKTGKSAKEIETARDAFFHVSLAIIDLHDAFGHATGDTYYLVFCPMARDNEGAHWLQKEDVVWNPFYGESMLRCGEIKQELHAQKLTTE
ncbi:MAG: efflux RND transporter periplasmic adaptor subunit [Candidatus Eiseniibacteriota bacterium]|nr:MAG: efflux RND transporter periplasmic adaptor subunit [Candidatus Eisenbacteria bacterium]